MSATDVSTVRVLVIVEDEPDMRTMIKALLVVDQRIEVCGEAASALEAVEAARSTHPGLVILDYSIEGDIMGIEAAPMIKEVAPEAKILLFTAFDVHAEAKAEPAIDAYLSKSDVSELRHTVLRMLGLDD